MNDTDVAWEIFCNNGFVEEKNKLDNLKCSPKVPESTPIYISTQTKIGFLNAQIPLNELFWKIPIIMYQTQKNGVIKQIGAKDGDLVEFDQLLFVIGDN